MADPAPIAVVLTAIPVEYDAVREHLVDIREQVHRAGTIFLLGHLRDGPWRVVLAKTGQGNTRAAALTERAISHYQPDLVLFVGVAGRLHTDLSLGDVVVAKKVYAVHGGKEDDTGFRPRPEVWWPDHGHLQRAELIAKSGTWLDALSDGERAEATAVVRAIASGEVVLNSVDSQYAQLIKKYYEDSAAIEMEGAGVAVTSQLNKSLPLLVVRGISDFADGQKEVTDRAGWQPRAARNAAAFAMTLLAEIEPTHRATAHVLAERLLFGTTEEQLAAVRELDTVRPENALHLLVKGFDAILDPDVSCRIIWAIAGLRTAAARDALRALNPRYEIERLVLRNALEAWWEEEQ